MSSRIFSRCAPPPARPRRSRLDGRTPAATPDSASSLKMPICPVASTCAPHNSTEKSPILITRTTSPYLSPKNASAPALMASSYAISSMRTGAFSRMRALISSSIVSKSLSAIAP